MGQTRIVLAEKENVRALALICAGLSAVLNLWRALPPEFGNWNSVYRYFCRLQQKGVFEMIFSELTKETVAKEISLDSTFVKVHRHGLGAKKGCRDT